MLPLAPVMLAAMHAVITAGGRVSGELAAAMGTPVKALARLGGISLLARTIEAARGAGAVQIAVVGGHEVRDAVANSIDVFIPEAPTGAQNVHLALHAFAQETLLYLTSDLPFIAAEPLRAFLARVPPASLAMPLAAAGDYERRFPGAPDHVTAIGGERIANGSVFLIPAGLASRIDSVAQKLFNARKDLLGMAMMLGPALLLKFALKRITIADVERKAADLFGCPAFAVRDADPELCFDIDSLEDYRYAIASA